MPAVTAELFFPSRQSSRLDVLDVEEATGRPRLTTAEAFGLESRNGLLCAGDPVNWTDPYGLTNWNTVGRGTVTTIVGVGGLFGSAGIGALTAWTGVGAFIGAAGMGGSAITIGLGVTTIADGFADRGAPTNISQGPAELVGQMTGNPNYQANGAVVDLIITSGLPPWWGGPATYAGSRLFPSGGSEGGSFDLNPGSPFSPFSGGYNVTGAGFEWIPGGDINVDGDITHEPGFFAPSGREEGSSAGGMSLGGYGDYGSSTAAAAGWEASWGGGSNSPLSQIQRHRIYRLK